MTTLASMPAVAQPHFCNYSAAESSILVLMVRAPLSRVCCLPLVVVLMVCAADAPSTQPATTEATSLAPPASVPATMPASGYRWRLVNDSVGGPCSGLVFTSQDASIRYCYGDTGGYRWDTLQQRWASFTDWNPDPQYGHVSGLAIDPNDRNVMYYAAGTTHGEVFKSTDRGRTFVATHFGAPGGGWVPLIAPKGGPTTGERIIVDGINSKVVYLATRLHGLWVTEDAATPGSWKQVGSLTARGDVRTLKSARGTVAHAAMPNGGLSFVAIDRRGGSIEVNGVRKSRTLFVGVIGDSWNDPADRAERTAESGVWRSNDGGQTWKRLAGPMEHDLVPTRAQIAADGDLWSTISGRVINIPRGGGASAVLGVPPGKAPIVAMAVDRLDPNHAVVARYGEATNGSYSDENRLFRTIDGGVSWTELKAEAAMPAWWGKFATRTAILRFEPNSPKDEQGRTRTLWLGDALGPWVCNDLDAPVTHWRLINRGRGGTIVSSLATPPSISGQLTAPLLAGTMELGGFRYLGVTAAPDARFGEAGSGATGKTWIAFCESDPRIVVVSSDASGGKQQRPAVLMSRDNGVKWFGLVDDAAPAAGPIAVGSSVKAKGWPALVRWPSRRPPRTSSDGGASWTTGVGAPAASANPPMHRLVADPLDPDRFYLLCDNPQRREGFELLVSLDGGMSWKPAAEDAAGEPPRAATVPVGEALSLAAQPGKSGYLWLARSAREESWSGSATRPASQPEPHGGLLRSTDGGVHWTAASGWDQAFCVAFGAPAPGRKEPSVVISGILRGKLGIYLCEDAGAALGDGASWEIVWDLQNTDTPAIRHCLREIAADRQAFGRIYAGASSAPRGLFYGEPLQQAAPAAPTNLSAVAGKSGVTLEWTDPVGVAEYDVQRATIDQPEQWMTVVTSAWQSKAIDASAKLGSRYLYRVIASNALGRSVPSAPVQSRPE